MRTQTLLAFGQVIFFVFACSEDSPLVKDLQPCKPGFPSQGDFESRLPEVCGNGVDDNCDTQVDENCPCQPGEVLLCGTDFGVCQHGIAFCQNGFFPVCIPKVSPKSEVYDNLDNDCDGQIDEELNPRERVDMLFLFDRSDGMWRYPSLRYQLAQLGLRFANTGHQFGLAFFPGFNPGEVVSFADSEGFESPVDFYRTVLGERQWNNGGRTRAPVYPALDFVVDPTNSGLLGWRAGAYPYIVIVTYMDPPKDQVIEEAVLAQLSACMLPGCRSPEDRVDVWVITQREYFEKFLPIVFGEEERLRAIHPINSEYYARILHEITRDLERR